MTDAAVMKLFRDLCKIKIVIYQQFFYPFDFMDDDELLNGNTPHLRKEIGKIGIVVIEFFAKKHRVLGQGRLV